KWADSDAMVAVASRGVDVPDHDPDKRALLWVDDAELAMATVLAAFAPPPDLPAIGVSEMASVDLTASIGNDVRIAAFVSIGQGASVGNGAVLHSGAVIGARCSVGAGSVMRAGAVLGADCVVGNECIVHANAVIGADGFGYRSSADGSELVKMPHIGSVVLGDHVEIGACTCIDRGKFASTTIGDGTKIDNHVQVGHNCRIGRHCVIAGCSGLSGSVTIGDWVRIGAMVGIADHRSVGDRASIGARSGVMHDVPAGAAWLGAPAMEAKKALRQMATLRKLPGIVARLRWGDDD
ncbi:MAG: UDP-3-O-(3-hydroxymyristoyl)glucosamine N-acyltransferase, partial [Phycisphaerales bacterium]|nr:UDP-3-O-(3-hydroxymyristoyl)glucosamine N-acyltransferase [Phycisphaerales bacterium]